MGGWVICFGSRSLARMLLYFTYPLAGNDLLINSLLGLSLIHISRVIEAAGFKTRGCPSIIEQVALASPHTSAAICCLSSKGKPQPWKFTAERIMSSRLKTML